MKPDSKYKKENIVWQEEEKKLFSDYNVDIWAWLQLDFLSSWDECFILSPPVAFDDFIFSLSSDHDEKENI